MEVWVQRHEDGETLYDVSDFNKLKRAYLTAIQYDVLGYFAQEVSEPSFTEESIKDLPDELQHQARMSWVNYKQYLERLQELKDAREMVLKIYNSETEKEFYDLVDQMEYYTEVSFGRWSGEIIELIDPDKVDIEKLYEIT